MSRKRKARREEQERRLKEFIQDFEHYEERRIGDKIWVKHWNGGTNLWQVAIFTEQSFRKYKNYGENRQLFENAINKED